MYATIDTRRPDELAAEPALVEAYPMTRIGDERTVTLALWTTTADAGAYEVRVDQRGLATGQPVGAAAVLWFDGPMSPARVAAAQFGYRRRVAPALAAVPGIVRMLQLWRDRDAASCVVTLTVDLAALDAAAHAVNSTARLAGEDPALLTGPDRVDIHHIVAREGISS